MRCVGIDYASANYSAVGLAVNGVPTRSAVWKPEDKHDSAPTRLKKYDIWLRRWIKILSPDVVAVEELAVFQNKLTIRAMARHEGVALLAASRSGAVVIHHGVTSSRRVVFGKGNISKDDAWVEFQNLYPDVTLLAKNVGGTDQMDAFTHALAAPTLLERH
ncbi:MAG TPA: crossover junction endodeoxyribonuclease RuvC [Nitrospiraceae bacterium]|nr:crossover junction endodeoxyribonuclease RuvC [Nitrospiraceae bacterium]